MVKLVAIAVVVSLLFEATALYFFKLARRAAAEQRSLLSEARLGNLVVAGFLALVGVLFLIFFVRNNEPF